jgi:hypothetical protein
MRNHYSSIMIVLIFMLLNPLYALSITVLFSIITNRVNNVLIAVLYVLSFTLLFSNQEFIVDSDLGSYIDMYHGTEFQSISSTFNHFLVNPNGREFLWLYYCMVIGVVTGYNTEAYVVVTYMLIFSLSAYMAFLVSENGRYNFALFLFSLIFFEMTFIDSGYDLWRNIVAVLLTLIGVVRYFSFRSKFISRVILYSAALIHLSMIPVIGIFELYIFFMNINDKRTLRNSIKLIFFIITVIFLALFLENQLILIAEDDASNPFRFAIEKYRNETATAIFSFRNYISTLYVLIVAYIIYNWKQLSHFDLFIFAVFFIIESLQHLSVGVPMIYSRASILAKIGLLFIAIKLVNRLNYKYIIAFVCIIFTLRMVILVSHSPNLWFLENIAKGDLFNPIYGLIFSILYFYDPFFYGPWFGSKIVESFTGYLPND